MFKMSGKNYRATNIGSSVDFTDQFLLFMEDIIQIIIYVAFGLLYTLSRYLRNKRKDKQRNPGQKKQSSAEEQPATEKPFKRSSPQRTQPTARTRQPEQSGSRSQTTKEPSRPKKGFTTTLEDMLREFSEEANPKQQSREETEPYQPTSSRYGSEETETRFDVPADQMGNDEEPSGYEPYEKSIEHDPEAHILKENPDYVGIGAENRGRAGAYSIKRKKSYARRVAQDLKKPSGLKKAIVLKEILDRKKY